MNEMLRLGLTLMVVTSISALALGFTNQLTEQAISDQQNSILKGSLSKAISADSFRESGSGYGAYDKQGNLIGRVLEVDTQGYSSVIKLLVGVDLSGVIQAIDILDQAETPGLGTRIEEGWFKDQFRGKHIESLNLRKDGGQIDAITGATISSRAVVDGIRAKIKDVLPDGKASPQQADKGMAWEGLEDGE